MDDRQARLLVVLSAAVIAAGLVFMLAPNDEEAAPWDEAATEAVWVVQAEQVSRIVLEQRDLPRVVVERADGAWRLIEPAPGPADAPRVEALLTALARVKLGIPVTGAKAEEVGLADPPRARVSLTTPAGEVRLDLGDAAPVGWQTYARTSAGRLVAIPGHFDQDVLVDPSTFQDATLVRFAMAEFQRLTLESPGGTLDVTRDEADGFWLAGYGRADGQAVENTLLTFAELRFDAFVDHLAPDGVTAWRHRARIQTRDGREVEIRFGDVLPMGRMAQGSSGRVGVLPPERLAFLDQGPTDLLDRRAFPVSSDRLDQIAVELEGARATLEGGGEAGWRSSGLSADQASAIFQALRSATIDWKAGPAPAPGPRAGVVSLREGEVRRRVIELYQVDREYRVAKDLSGGNPYLIPEADLQRLAKALQAATDP